MISAGHIDLDPALRFLLHPLLHPTAQSEGTPGAEKVNQNKTTTGETRLCRFPELLVFTPENRCFHRTLSPSVSGERGSAAAVTSGWLEGCNPTY